MDDHIGKPPEMDAVEPAPKSVILSQALVKVPSREGQKKGLRPAVFHLLRQCFQKKRLQEKRYTLDRNSSILFFWG